MDAVTARLERLLDRTARLHRLTARLSTAMQKPEVAEIVVDEGTTALDAISGALWRFDPLAQRLLLVRATNYPPEAIASVESLPLDPTIPIADAAIRREPIWLSSRADYEARYNASAARTRELASPVTYAVAAMPLVLRDQLLGALCLTFTGEHMFDDDEKSYLAFLALHCAQAFERVRLYHAMQVGRERATFLARASALLGSSLDYEDTLRNVATLACPTIGDWCGVELVDPAGGTKQVAVAHVDPAKIEYAHELRRRYPPDQNAQTGVPQVLRTGKSEMYPDIPDQLLVASTVDAEHLRIIRELGLRSVMIVPIKDRGITLGVISFIAAESGRRYTEEDLQMAEQLAERAGAAISNAQLYSAAREAIRIRDEFMLIAGHELRTPLASLALHHEALVGISDLTPHEKIRERGKKLQAQTARLGRLVEDLLDVSRIAAGRLTLEVEELDLGVFAREVAERMREDLDRARCPLELHLEPTHGRWDKARIDQILVNLLSNAAKYGKGAPVSLRVRPEGNTAQITIVDHGIGIAAADQPRIFDRFERAVSPRKFGGLGLGLWITAQLVDAHLGAIEVISQPGEGATFIVTLPLDGAVRAPA